MSEISWWQHFLKSWNTEWKRGATADRVRDSMPISSNDTRTSRVQKIWKNISLKFVAAPSNGPIKTQRCFSIKCTIFNTTGIVPQQTYQNVYRSLATGDKIAFLDESATKTNTSNCPKWSHQTVISRERERQCCCSPLCCHSPAEAVLLSVRRDKKKYA